ncbi:MAG: preprotein translocase subunit SecE [Bacilli bacterium]|nr:preprotein translocase subunit SecE [Bacilli bacterium]
MKKLAKFFVSVREEMKKVTWPSKKEMIKYSIATLSFILLFVFFFTLTDAVIAGLTELKGLIK